MQILFSSSLWWYTYKFGFVVWRLDYILSIAGYEKISAPTLKILQYIAFTCIFSKKLSPLFYSLLTVSVIFFSCVDSSQTTEDPPGSRPTSADADVLDKKSDSFLPRISLVHSLPLDYNKILQMTDKGDDWAHLISSGGSLDKRIKSGVMRTVNTQGT